MNNTKPILLVEDNDDDVRLTRRALHKNNILNDMIVMRDGVEALAYLRAAVAPGATRAHGLPALILLDLKLPKMDGLEVLRELRADPRLRRQPVVILTSSKEEQDIIRSYDLGANSYIHKPVDFEQFSTAVNQLQLYWLILNEAPPPPAG
ncbi:MAG TPA: response regulator [Rariglobus sp.]